MQDPKVKAVRRVWVVGLLFAGSVFLALLIAPRGQAQKAKQPAPQLVLYASVHASLPALRNDDEDQPCARFRGDNHDNDANDEDRELNNRIRQGFAIAPVPLNLEDKNCALVGLGSYLVNSASACVDCHTQPTYAPGHNPFLGQPEQINVTNYLGGGKAFGPFVSRNLTPEAPSGLPAGLTFDQFNEVLRKGTDFEHAHPQFGPLLQVMPWPQYTPLTDRDIRAMYEYLRSVPHAEPGH